MICASVLELCVRYIDDPLPCFLRDHVNESQYILAGVSESHASSKAALIVAGGPAHVERDHALILVPCVDGSVKCLVSALDRIYREKIFPVVLQLLESTVYLLVCSVLRKYCFRRLFVYHRRARYRLQDIVLSTALLYEFTIARVLAVCEHEYERLRFAGSQAALKMMAPDDRPAARHAVSAFSRKHGFRPVCSRVAAEERGPVRIKAREGFVHGEDGVMVPPLAVLCLVIYVASRDLHFAGGIVPLEIGHVVLSVPVAELDIAEEVQILLFLAFVR